MKDNPFTSAIPTLESLSLTPIEKALPLEFINEKYPYLNLMLSSTIVNNELSVNHLDKLLKEKHVLYFYIYVCE